MRFTVVPLRTDPASLACADCQQQGWGRNLPCSITQRVLTEYLLWGVWNILESASYPSPKELRFGDFPGVLQKTSICQISGESQYMPLHLPYEGALWNAGDLMPDYFVYAGTPEETMIWKLNRKDIQTWLGKLGNRELYLQFEGRTIPYTLERRNCL